MILIIYPDVDIWNFVLKGLAGRADIQCLPLNPSCGRLRTYIRKMFPNANIPGYFIFGRKLLKLIRSMGGGDSIVLSDYSDKSLFYAISGSAGIGCSFHYWIWNPIRSNMHLKNNIEVIRKLGFQIHTFDCADACKYEINQLDQFFPITYYRTSTPKSIEYDFYFAGFAKDRKTLLEDLSKILSKNYRVYFHIVESSSDYIPYQENISNVEKSRCLVDIVQGEQSGITLRPLEALTFRKKLLTNNKHIKDLPFFSRSNIFILGEDDLDELDAFIESPFVDIAPSVLNSYDIESWVENFR